MITLNFQMEGDFQKFDFIEINYCFNENKFQKISYGMPNIGLMKSDVSYPTHYSFNFKKNLTFIKFPDSEIAEVIGKGRSSDYYVIKKNNMQKLSFVTPPVSSIKRMQMLNIDYKTINVFYNFGFFNYNLLDQFFYDKYGNKTKDNLFS
jgi:hypothetical protein